MHLYYKKHILWDFSEWPEYRGGHISGVLIRGSSLTVSLHNNTQRKLLLQYKHKLSLCSNETIGLCILTEYTQRKLLLQYKHKLSLCSNETIGLCILTEKLLLHGGIKLCLCSITVGHCILAIIMQPVFLFIVYIIIRTYSTCTCGSITSKANVTCTCEQAFSVAAIGIAITWIRQLIIETLVNIWITDELNYVVTKAIKYTKLTFTSLILKQISRCTFTSEFSECIDTDTVVITRINYSRTFINIYCTQI